MFGRVLRTAQDGTTEDPAALSGHDNQICIFVMPHEMAIRSEVGIVMALMLAPAVPYRHTGSVQQNGFDLRTKQSIWPTFVLQQNMPPSKENVTNLEKVLAFAYISVGNKSTTETFLLLSLSTLRRAGGWRGDVFVITDRAECIPLSATPVVVPPAPAGSTEKAGKKYGKHFKQRLLQILPLSPHQRYVFYIDMDIFIGSAVGPFLLRTVADFEANKAAIALLREGTGINGQNDFNSSLRKKPKGLYHGGMLLVSTEAASAACLQHWSSWYTSSSGADQPQLTKSVNAGACNVSFLDQESYAQPTNDTAGTYGTFNHFTRSGRMLGKHGMLSEHFTLAGEVLLGLDGELARCWWNVLSPLCESEFSLAS